MITIGFCNLKGGVGKTTACQNIAVALAKAKYKVAVVDMDPQSNLSAGFGVTPAETEAQVFDLLSGGAGWDDIVTKKEGVDIIPSCLNLAMAELNDTSPVSRNTALREALSKVDADRYDFVLLDSPPQLGVFTRNVLAASDKIIVPMDGGFYSLFGLRLLNGAMPVFRQRLNASLEIMGILMTNYNPRLYIARQVYDEVGKTFGDVLFRNCIRQNVSLVEASSMGMSIFEYSPKSKGAECYRDVARELVEKLNMKPKAKKAKPEPEQQPEPEPEPASEPQPEVFSEPAAGSQATKTETPEPEPTPTPAPSAPEPVTPPAPPAPPAMLDPYAESIKESVLEMLPAGRQGMWKQILDSVSYISRAELDARELRQDFEDCDKERYKFYVLNDEKDSFWPVVYSDQIIDPMRCVLKFDEYEGSADVYI